MTRPGDCKTVSSSRVRRAPLLIIGCNQKRAEEHGLHEHEPWLGKYDEKKMLMKIVDPNGEDVPFLLGRAAFLISTVR